MMPAGARIVFVTSHQAHFFPGKPVPDGYEPIAVSKCAGEDAVLAAKPALAEHGIELRLVPGDMIDGTIGCDVAAASDGGGRDGTHRGRFTMRPNSSMAAS